MLCTAHATIDGVGGASSCLSPCPTLGGRGHALCIIRSRLGRASVADLLRVGKRKARLCLPVEENGTERVGVGGVFTRSTG